MSYFIWAFVVANLIGCGSQLYLHHLGVAFLNLFVAVFVYFITRPA
jgi:hypothetical protein